MSLGIEDESLESLPSPGIEDEDESFEPLPDDSASSQTSSDYDHDVAELFSRPRIVPHCSAQRQLVGGPSVDIKTGVDLLRYQNRRETQRKLDKHRTKVVVLSPPYRIDYCDRGYIKKNLRKEADPQKEAEAFELLQFAMDVAKAQHQNRRKIIFEHPVSATSWRTDIVKSVKDAPGIYTVDFDQCALGLCTKVKQTPTQKRTRLLTNLPGVVTKFREFQCVCEPVNLINGRKQKHMRLVGSEGGLTRKAYANVYPPAMCNAMAECIADHCK